jgi:branched-chain amino acid aminotransferase
VLCFITWWWNKFKEMFELPFIIKNSSIVEVQPIAAPQMQVYEVIRFIDGLPIFFDEHFDRFLSSCRLAGVSYHISKETLATLLVDLAQKNGVQGCNLKYLVNVSDGEVDFYAGFIKSHYPSEEMYRKGVSVGLLYEERANPNAKVLNPHLRSKADALIARRGYYEVALVNHQQKITEGSRSNLFFIDADGCVITAPLGDVLGGITRKVILEEIQALKLPFAERAVGVDELGRMVAGFVSGTSPSVLPIAEIEGQRLAVPMPAVEQLWGRYLARVAQDKLSFRHKYL